MLIKKLLILVTLQLSIVSAEDSYSPYVTQTFPTTAYWGDTHIHTNLSLDAYAFKTTLGPAEAYRFARGETLTADNGMKVRLRKPLDFLVVADHANNLGVYARLEKADPVLLSTELGGELYAQYQALQSNQETAEKNLFVALQDIFNPMKSSVKDPIYRQSIWDEIAGTADKVNSPGKFTAFIGFEWSGERYSDDLKGNRHRVVIFKDDSSKATQMLPYSLHDSLDPEDLWQLMAEYESKTSGEVLAIPHNANLSYGEMFAETDVKGQPFSVKYAKTRSRWEPLYEITQVKGDSEAHPILSPSDEFADFETWNSWGGKMEEKLGLDKHWSGWSEEENRRKKNEYARSAWKTGLRQQAKLGINPFKFGVIGSTDAHTALSAVAENNFWGKYQSSEPNPDRSATDNTMWSKSLNAAGYAAVWAHENTRDSIFAAMKRKEVYASTGPRIMLRFFGGWDYQNEDAFSPDLAAIGYSGGVPMGGDLTRPREGKAPRFLIRSVKDPDGANLDRVQVIKGWRSEDGELHENVYDVALSDGRKITRNKRSKSVGSTVNIKNATYQNTIGDPELSTVWEDPDFDASELAFYYVRVLEIPTPRWTAYDAKFFKLKDIPKETPMVTQERAYSSPIWFTPSR